jgi:hypothetical protein
VVSAFIQLCVLVDRLPHPLRPVTLAPRALHST